MTPIIDAYRAVLLLGPALPGDGRSRSQPSPPRSLLLAGAWVMFHRAEFEFAENI